ncbi:endonuclease/exonuclease/phosphatase family protein [Denitrificimonas sp. JX-1]|uniref:Endonuclease/exonuclease/phosphatase family protein n=2 Tax=Denitrificimonas halotolerans TaxID=3098930 RepID=A0ABU5GQW9_9GAMM|nr:endonuclease/exonuclease/phosphatase family protein [Denitrificimonas sp. JX-1]MDY7219380.1 endonuclease/exonuclease/phosphatase family protein [Denitrificimonas sp. JX-1]
MLMPRRFSKERSIILCDANYNRLSRPDALPRDGQRIRLLSFNIQVGISTSAYRHYVTRSWKHLLPHQERYRNLEKIGFLLGDYDIVALQEADGGSLRSGNINQVQQLAQLGNFPYWYQQRNRNLGPFAQHSNGLLTRVAPQHLEDHPLPGPAGRGAILAKFGEGDNAIAVVSMHLALGTRARNLQLGYIREIVSDYKHIVLMGDMNTHAENLLINSPLSSMDLRAPQICATFPSWKPQRCLDHILISPELGIENMSVLPFSVSDHLPVAMDIILPEPLALPNEQSTTQA